jgi:hypothetical protein
VLCILLVKVQYVIHYVYVNKYAVMPLNVARHFIASKILQDPLREYSLIKRSRTKVMKPNAALQYESISHSFFFFE